MTDTAEQKAQRRPEWYRRLRVARWRGIRSTRRNSANSSITATGCGDWRFRSSRERTSGVHRQGNFDVNSATMKSWRRLPRAEWESALWIVTHVDLHRTTKVQTLLAHLKETAKGWPSCD